MVSGCENQYEESEFALVIPTYNRPKEIEKLLNSLEEQDVKYGQIVIVDSGDISLDKLISKYKELNIDYHRCDEKGQLIQRNIGIARLDPSIRLVGCIDDDIVFEKGSFKVMIDFWSRSESDTAGVSFNIVNSRPHKYSRIKSIFGMSARKQGVVLTSGYHSPSTPVSTNLRTQWLCGGAVIWNRHIFDTNKFKMIEAKWAVSEDLIFSYPIGKSYSLYVCADAKVRHEQPLNHVTKRNNKYCGRTYILWQYYFVDSHKELSNARFVWSVCGQIMGRCLLSLKKFNMDGVEFALGQLEGLQLVMKAKRNKKDLIELLKE